MDILNDALIKIRHYEQLGKKEVLLQPTSNLLQNVLSTLQKHHYIGEVERIEDGKGGKFLVQLLGRINKTAVIKPRFPVKVSNILKYEKKYLPASDFGILVLSTPKGVMSQNEAIEQHVGGRLLAYVY
ncbi:MAG: 30S ribosomal protein S8 [Candidatus Heimdallarchaeota archaeon]|nr:30S ribosomal protein S8 [Candidatus Heimdallarchaeota archaeon]